MTPEDKIVAAIDKNTKALDEANENLMSISLWLFLLWMGPCVFGCPSAKASPLISDGDEITSIGTVQVITPHPSWAQPLEGTSWISIAQTGWPLATWLPNGTVVSFSEAFSLDSMPSSAMVTWAADDSASLWLNGALVAAEAPMGGNTYSTCSDAAPTCRSHTVTDILPWLTVGSNEIRFDVAQRGGWSYGLNYAVGIGWLDEPVSVPEPGTWWLVWVVLGAIAVKKYWEMSRRVRQYGNALRRILSYGVHDNSREIALKALEE